jgi:hypothetical protein
MEEKKEPTEIESIREEISILKGTIKALLKWLILSTLRNKGDIYAEDIYKTYSKLRPYYAKAQEELLQEGRIWIDKTGRLMLIEAGEDKEK